MGAVVLSGSEVCFISSSDLSSGAASDLCAHRFPLFSISLKCMELSREVYNLIVRHVSTRADLLTLCTVSRRFQLEAQRALYNTLHLHGFSRIMARPQLSLFVEALSLFPAEERPNDSDSDDGSERDAGEDKGKALPHDFWQIVASECAVYAVRVKFSEATEPYDR